MDGRVYLKIKLKALAAESRIIRHEERKRKVNRFDVSYNPGINPEPEVKAASKTLRDQSREQRAKRRSRDWYPKSLAELHQLQLHRRNVVSKEARLTHIAYAFIRGRTLAQTDKGAGLLLADYGRVATMVKKYGPTDFQMKSLETWLGLDLSPPVVEPSSAVVPA